MRGTHVSEEYMETDGEDARRTDGQDGRAERLPSGYVFCVTQKIWRPPARISLSASLK